MQISFLQQRVAENKFAQLPINTDSVGGGLPPAKQLFFSPWGIIKIIIARGYSSRLQ